MIHSETRDTAARPDMAKISRRLFVLGAAATLAGCQSERLASPGASAGPGAFAGTGVYDPTYVAMYGPRPDEKFPLPAVDLSYIDPRFYRTEVDTPAAFASRPGTIVVSPGTRYLYLVQANGRSMRYGVGVGREGFGWSGEAVIRRKETWPTWTPPPQMVKRDPTAAPFANGMPPGLDNPLGARAMYLYQGDQDTLYRLHGTSEPWSIGTAVSSGCIRLINQDVIDLYSRVPLGTNVRVLADGTA